MKIQKGQILIITLLVLTIIAIVTVSLVSLVNRDVQQVASTQQYEDAYNTAETQLKKVLDVYGKPNTVLDQITNTFNSPTDITCTGSGTYNCSIKSSEFSTAELNTQMTIKDTNTVTDFPIYKDRSFDMNLSGYQDSLDFKWDKNAAMEFELIYTVGGEIRSVRDVYDYSSDRVYTSLVSDNPFDAFSTTHPFKFKHFVGQADDNAVSIKLTDVVDLSGATVLPSGTTVTLKITPRMKNQFDSVLLNVSPSNNAALPNQIREFSSQSYNINGGNSTPVASIQTKVPLAAQPDSVLDSSIITNGILKNTP